MIRCRRNALAFNVHPIPIFCPFDDIVPRISYELVELSRQLEGVVVAEVGNYEQHSCELLGFAGLAVATSDLLPELRQLASRILAPLVAIVQLQLQAAHH